MSLPTLELIRYNANNNGSNEVKAIFDIKNYNTKYSLTIFSNKTKNSYEVEEWYLYNNGKEYKHTAQYN